MAKTDVRFMERDCFLINPFRGKGRNFKRLDELASILIRFWYVKNFRGWDRIDVITKVFCRIHYIYSHWLKIEKALKRPISNVPGDFI